MKNYIIHIFCALLFSISLTVVEAAPTVTTLAADQVTSTSVRFRASIGSGSGTITERRFDWLVPYTTGAALSQVTSNVVVAGSEFFLTLNNLPASTKVGFRGWAKNSVGQWGNGAIVSTTTSAPAGSPPGVATGVATTTSLGVILPGSITSTNGGAITEARLYWRLNGMSVWDWQTVNLNGTAFQTEIRGVGGAAIDYYAWASNAYGSGQGQTRTIVAPVLGPTVETVSATTVGTTLALRGRVLNTNGYPLTSLFIKFAVNSPLFDSSANLTPDAGGYFQTRINVAAGTPVSWYAEGTTSTGTGRGATMSTTMPAFAPDAPTALFPWEIKQTSMLGRMKAASYTGGSPLVGAEVQWTQFEAPFGEPASLDSVSDLVVDTGGNSQFTIPSLIPGTYTAMRWRVTNAANLVSPWSTTVWAFTSDPIGFRPEIAGWWFDDGTAAFQHGDADQLPEAGEAGTLHVTIRNTGDMPAPATTTVEFLHDPSAGLRLLLPDEPELVLEPGEAAEITWEVYLLSSLASGTVITPKLYIVDPLDLRVQLPVPIAIAGRSANTIIPEPGIDLESSPGSVCVTAPAWALQEYKLESSIDLLTWVEMSLLQEPLIDSDGESKTVIPLTKAGFFRLKHR